MSIERMRTEADNLKQRLDEITGALQRAEIDLSDLVSAIEDTEKQMDEQQDIIDSLE